MSDIYNNALNFWNQAFDIIDKIRAEVFKECVMAEFALKNGGKVL